MLISTLETDVICLALVALGAVPCISIVSPAMVYPLVDAVGVHS